MPGEDSQIHRSLIASMAEGVCVQDVAGRITAANPAAARILGCTVERLLSGPPESSPWSVVGEDGTPIPWQAQPAMVALRTGSSQRDVVVGIRRLDGALVWIGVNAEPLVAAGETSPYAVVTTFHDLTGPKRAEQERAEHLRFLEAMDRVNRAVQANNDLDRMTAEVLDLALGIFGCDRAGLVQHCDPDAPTWTLVMDRARPGLPAIVEPWHEVPMEPALARVFRLVLRSERPVQFGPNAPEPVPAFVTDHFGIRSTLAVAIDPRIGDRWVLAIHRCGEPRLWTAEEERLLTEIGRRLTDGLATRLASRELRESERRFRLVFENSPVSIWEEDFSAVRKVFDELRREGVTDAEAYFAGHPEVVRRCAQLTRIVDVSRAAVSLHGASSKNALLEGLVSTFTPESFDAFQRELVCLWNGGTELSLDSTVKTLAGEPRQVTVWFSVCPGYEESLGKVLVSLVDITDRIEAEQRMRVSEERLRLTLEATQIGVWDWDVKNDLWFASPIYFTMLGYEAQTGYMDRAVWLDRIHPEDREMVRTRIQSVLVGDAQNYEYEARLRHANGTYRWVHVIGFGIVHGSDGKVTRLLGVRMDVTERRQAEDKLKQQATLLDQTHDVVMVLGIDGRFTYCNRSAEQVYGIRQSALNERDAPTLLFGDHPERYGEICHATRQYGRWTGEVRFACPMGANRIALSRWTLINDSAGRPSSYLIVSTDVTEQKQLEEQLLRAQRVESIGTLASGVAHDLNNILAPILMSVGLLQQSARTDEDRQTLEMIEKSTLRGTGIVNQLLTFGRGMRGERVAVQLRALLKDMATVVNETFPKNITLVLHVPSNLWVIEANATQVHQVLMNLCVNARDAMPCGGELTLAAENVMVDESIATMTPEAKPGPYVVLEVSDTGTGIAPEHLNKIFDPFFTTKDFGKGTGLGLSTVLGIVRGHGGFVLVDSQVGEGTQFRIYLPAQTVVDETPVRLDHEPLPKGHGELVLFVDDEEIVRTVGRTALQFSGYRVVTAGDGREALAAFSQSSEPFAAVITDMMMPVMDGVALIRAIRAQAPDIVIIATSGMPEQEATVVEAGLGRGAFLIKPFGADTLIRTLHELLADSRR